MIKKLFLFFAFCSTLLVNAQYTTVINSNRPGFSESPYSVGSGVYQFESSLFFRKINATPTFSNPQAIGLNLLFRTSFFSEKLEFNLNTSLQNDKNAFKNVFESSYTQTGFGNLTLGAKYLVYTPKYDDKSKEIRSWKARHSFDWKRWIPHVGVYAGLNFGSILNDYHKKGGVTPKVGVLLQNEFSDKLNVISNLYYDYIGSDFSEFSYIITGTYNFNDYWSGFAELQGSFEKYQRKSNIGFGAAYLYSENLQLNATARIMRQQSEIGFYTGVGVSYRINRHKDEFVEVDEFGNKIVEQKETKYDENKGFFGRLFSKVKKLFKKKEKQTIVIDDGEKKEEITIEKPRRQRQKSLVDVIAKEDKKQKKKTTKAEKKAAKKAKKKAEKDARNKAKEAEKAAKKKEKERLKLEKDLKKEKEKEAKRKEKERLKLAKEIKKLEEELKKEEEKEKKKDK
ncbi:MULTISPECIES: transporter [unclassified Tenacibaculum]|uniref:transporter n=1 Tax=unclassified Tenacibaculum TaxID=2635139 RepID=UPI001F450C4E|nr:MULTISPECIES: transporter [unclassified Tenacibaculum]MCF2876145.1 transporter [Tenacibaculum sp. Cn5-1]MCF2936220.1 transporter [Tenacibaculum sp. Cn5-34]MCG7511563.1 transporter [Tenacibaculum sp. Cn5-46]